jgi:hypothetical protein
MSSLVLVILLLTGYTLYWILFAALFYRIAAGLLCFMSVVPGVRRLVSANVGKGTDTFRFTLGKLFAWTVSVNREKGTLTGSIQIDAARQLGWQRLLVAGAAAALVPMVAGVLMPAALVVVGFGFLRGAPRPAARAGESAHGPDDDAASPRGAKTVQSSF